MYSQQANTQVLIPFMKKIFQVQLPVQNLSIDFQQTMQASFVQVDCIVWSFSYFVLNSISSACFLKYLISPEWFPARVVSVLRQKGRLWDSYFKAMQCIHGRNANSRRIRWTAYIYENNQWWTVLIKFKMTSSTLYCFAIEKNLKRNIRLHYYSLHHGRLITNSNTSNLTSARLYPVHFIGVTV